MRKWFVALFCVLAVFAMLHSRPAAACRYSVREVGFVDLDRSPYRLFVYRTARSDEKLMEEVQRAAALRLRGANVEFEAVDLSDDPDNVALQYFQAPAGPETRQDSQSTDDGSLQAVLVSPDERTLQVLLPNDEAQLATTMESVVLSDARERIRDEIVEAYCIVLMVEGPDDAENARARAVVQESVGRMTAGMGSVEKPTEKPPMVVEVPWSAHEEERVLLWALGMVPGDIEHPGIALLFGRARRIGAALRGDRVDADELVRLMMFVGASCECGLDRNWMQGPMLPLRWDRNAYERLTRHLGFDPDSPMVRMEIGQILSQGSESGGLRYDDPFMGYREFAGTAEGPSGAAVLDTSMHVPDMPEPAAADVPAAPATATGNPPVPMAGAAQEKTASPLLAVLACVVAANVVILVGYLIRARQDRP